MTVRLDRIFPRRHVLPAHFLAAFRRAPKSHGVLPRVPSVPGRALLTLTWHLGAGGRPASRWAAETNTAQSG